MYDDRLFWKIFARRAAISFFIIIFFFLTCILRIAIIATSPTYSVAQNYNRLKISLGNPRGTIFDKNMYPLTNNKKKIIAVVTPTPRAITAISSVLKGDELERVLNELKQNKPVSCVVPKFIECDGIICTEIYENDNQNVNHFIGYCDNQSNGISGLELACNDILKAKKDISVYYECNGKGEILPGSKPKIEGANETFSNAIITTFDANILNIVENSAQNLKKGAIIVADANNGKIRAAVSRPSFKLEDIANLLDDENSPLLNRAINNYNVGSAFKPCVAAAGIEYGYQSFCYNCTGSCQIIDRFFKCHNLSGHSLMNLKSGLANSCNTYFYNFAFNIGGNAILKTAKNFKFGKSLAICDGILTASGSLPESNELENIANLANFSIGQGKLLLSPVSILTLYSAIATDGKYYTPSILEATVKNGEKIEYNIGNPTRALKRETANILRNYLSAVLSEGTGKDAMPKTVSAAGKTATAQTGKWENGAEICQGWFCGFFPLERPKYVVIIFSENTREQDMSCNEIFAEIADQVTLFEK